MREYVIKIRETMEELVTVEASSEQEAKEKVKAAWKNGDYILGSKHFLSVAFILCEKKS